MHFCAIFVFFCMYLCLKKWRAEGEPEPDVEEESGRSVAQIDKRIHDNYWTRGHQEDTDKWRKQETGNDKYSKSNSYQLLMALQYSRQDSLPYIHDV